MDGKITHVTLVVSNQAKSLEFFTEKAGFEKKADITGPGGYRWITVGLKGQDLELALHEMGAPVDPTQKDLAVHWAPGKAPPIVIQVPDCKTLYAQLHGRGVMFTRPPEDHPWGTVATFVDPDGNLFSISQLGQGAGKG